MTKTDHRYHVKHSINFGKSAARGSYLNEVLARSSKAGPAKYSKVEDWSLKNGMMIGKQKKMSYVDEL